MKVLILSIVVYNGNAKIGEKCEFGEFGEFGVYHQNTSQAGQ